MGNAYVAQNAGAGKPQRAKKALYYSIGTSVLAGLVMFQGIFAAFCIRIPVSWAVSRMAGASLFHIGLGIPVSTVVQILLCLLFMFYLSKKQACLFRTVTIE